MRVPMDSNGMHVAITGHVQGAQLLLPFPHESLHLHLVTGTGLCHMPWSLYLRRALWLADPPGVCTMA